MTFSTISASLDLPADTSYRGNIDIFDPQKGIGGWVLDLDEPSKVIFLDLLADGEVIAECQSGKVRTDISEWAKNDSMPGFEFRSDIFSILNEHLSGRTGAQIQIRIRGLDLVLPPGAQVWTPDQTGPSIGESTPDLTEDYDYFRMTGLSSLGNLHFGTAADYKPDVQSNFKSSEQRVSLSKNGSNLAAETSSFPPASVDVLFFSETRRCLVIGWAYDQHKPLCSIAIARGQTVLASTEAIARCRRPDAEGAVSAPPGKLLGFWAVFEADEGVSLKGDTKIFLSVGDEHKSFMVWATPATDEGLRETALEYFAKAKYFANPQLEASAQLDGGIGGRLVDLSVDISRRIIGKAHCTRFGPERASYDGSIVVCLYGKAEFLFLQAAFFSACQDWDRYEFIYVSNSPELAEVLCKEAAMAARLYGISLTLVILPGNAGFGAANNIAVNYARSDRVLIVNPDCFPRETGWARAHTDLVKSLPAEQTAMFGVPLYYDDGSLMHGGMFFDIDIGLSIRENGIEQHEMIRVEHYGKGAPPDTPAYLRSRPIPAVTGAFISMDRAWFETLGGFSLEYVFGHYEDADLCLKSYDGGKRVWMHNIPFWHLEGKGSTRRIVHEGGSLVNRWHFTKRWGDLVKTKFRGKTPAALASS